MLWCRWFFLPRRASPYRYDDKEDQKRGVNHLLRFDGSESTVHDEILRNRVDEAFTTVEILGAGPLNPLHGAHHITSHHITSQHNTTHHITSHHITSHHIASDHITAQHITSHHITLAGFSTFKFVPGTRDHDIVALKTLEHNDDIQTYITVFNLEGQVLLDATLISE